MKKNGVNHSDAIITERIIEEKVSSDKNGIDSDVTDDSNDDFRDNKGRFTAGNKFGKGRPPAGMGIIEQFRENPRGMDLIQQIFDIASTLGQKGQHRDAMTCAKLVIERLVPALKSSELKIETDENAGFVILPEQKKPKSE